MEVAFLRVAFGAVARIITHLPRDLHAYRAGVSVRAVYKAFFNSFLYNCDSFILSLGPVGELAETTSLLRTRSRKVTEGSNPSLSATSY